MKTKFAICLLAAIGLHAGLLFLGSGSGPELPMHAVIEVGLEHSENTTLENKSESQAPPDLKPVPAPEQAIAPTPIKTEPALKEVVDTPAVPEKIDAAPADAPPQPAPVPPVAIPPPSRDTPRQTAAPSRSVPARLGGGGDAENVSTVRYRERASLSYPTSALRQKIGGKVVLLVEIDTTGHATSVNVRQSSGQPDLDAAAIRCARQSTYEPYRVNGIARPSRVEAPFEFKAPQS